MPPSPKDFLGRTVVMQTTSNWASAGAHGNGLWTRGLWKKCKKKNVNLIYSGHAIQALSLASFPPVTGWRP